MKRMLNNKRGWQRFHFVSPLQGLVCFGGDLPRAALADSLCPGLSYFALSGQRKKFVPCPGFSLVELLTVIAIIVVIASLLLAVASRGRNAAHRIVCLNNARHIVLGVIMYCGDSNDKTPASGQTNLAAWIAYKELVKNYVGLRGASSSQDKIFSCPADKFYYDYRLGRVPESHHDQAKFDFSSYTFNALNWIPPNSGIRPRSEIKLPGLAGLRLSSIKHPSRTVMIAESPAFYPYSWHEPKPRQPGSVGPAKVVFFNNAPNNVGFVDGHANYVKIYWGNIITNGGFMACDYDPPDWCDYQWSAD
jgi:prepilin-type N-terminal cleavage/methylation domain-containing protein